MKKATVYLIQKSVDHNFNTMEIGFFEGVLAAFGINDYASGTFTSDFISYTFITTSSIDDNIKAICDERGLHYKRGDLRIKLNA